MEPIQKVLHKYDLQGTKQGGVDFTAIHKMSKKPIFPDDLVFIILLPPSSKQGCYIRKALQPFVSFVAGKE